MHLNSSEFSLFLLLNQVSTNQRELENLTLSIKTNSEQQQRELKSWLNDLFVCEKVHKLVGGRWVVGVVVVIYYVRVWISTVPLDFPPPPIHLFIETDSF